MLFQLNIDKSIRNIIIMKNRDFGTSPCEKGTYFIREQGRLRRACASAQSRQNFRSSFTKYMELEKASDKKATFLTPLSGCSCAFERSQTARRLSSLFSRDGSFIIFLHLPVIRRLKTNIHNKLFHICILTLLSLNFSVKYVISVRRRLSSQNCIQNYFTF